MPKVTSKLQLTVPKSIADQYGIRAGDELEWMPAGEAIRVIPAGNAKKAKGPISVKERIELFDKATQRQQRREAALQRGSVRVADGGDRGWKREDLYGRGRSD
jgi:AbrB family looped-hinge helix DNA binding protein